MTHFNNILDNITYVALILKIKPNTVLWKSETTTLRYTPRLETITDPAGVRTSEHLIKEVFILPIDIRITKEVDIPVSQGVVACETIDLKSSVRP